MYLRRRLASSRRTETQKPRTCTESLFESQSRPGDSTTQTCFKELLQGGDLPPSLKEEIVPIPSLQQSWKWTGGFPKRKTVFQHPPVSFHDCWREAIPSNYPNRFWDTSPFGPSSSDAKAKSTSTTIGMKPWE